MKSKIRRLAIIGSLGAALSGLAAGSAQAAILTTTLPATTVTTTTAELNGTVATGGAAVVWQFQYGKTTSYGQTTTAQVIPAGRGTVAVLDKVKGLHPNTKYHFRLSTQQGTGTTYYPIVITNGQDRTFTTKKRGSLSLLGTRLTVKKSVASIPLKCASTQTCKGKLTLTARVKIGNKHETLTFGSQSFTIRAGRTTTLKPKLSKTGLKLLKNARHQRFGVKLTVKLTTGQDTLSQNVTLLLK